MDLSIFYTVDENGEQVEAPRPETKSWPDVEQCIKHNHGQPCATIDRFIEMAGLGEQWDWFDSYKDWQAECERLTALNAERVPDEETGELPEPYPLPDMPPRPAVVDLAQWKLDHACLFVDQGADNAVARRKRENIKWYEQDPVAAYRQLVNMALLDPEVL